MVTDLFFYEAVFKFSIPAVTCDERLGLHLNTYVPYVPTFQHSQFEFDFSTEHHGEAQESEYLIKLLLNRSSRVP